MNDKLSRDERVLPKISIVLFFQQKKNKKMQYFKMI